MNILSQRKIPGVLKDETPLFFSQNRGQTTKKIQEILQTESGSTTREILLIIDQMNQTLKNLNLPKGFLGGEYVTRLELDDESIQHFHGEFLSSHPNLLALDSQLQQLLANNPQSTILQYRIFQKIWYDFLILNYPKSKLKKSPYIHLDEMNIANYLSSDPERVNSILQHLRQGRFERDFFYEDMQFFFHSLGSISLYNPLIELLDIESLEYFGEMLKNVRHVYSNFTMLDDLSLERMQALRGFWAGVRALTLTREKFSEEMNGKIAYFFSGLGYLKYLNLSFTSIFELSEPILESIFSPLTECRSLNLQGLNFFNLSSYSKHVLYAVFDRLVHIDLSHGKLSILSARQLGEMFSHLSNLTTLEIEKNALDTMTQDQISAIFSHLPNMRALDISGHELLNLERLEMIFDFCMPLESLKMHFPSMIPIQKFVEVIPQNLKELKFHSFSSFAKTQKYIQTKFPFVEYENTREFR